MTGCTNKCEQGRLCDCRDFMTTEESRRFWRTLAVFMVADIALIAVVLWVVK